MEEKSFGKNLICNNISEFCRIHIDIRLYILDIRQQTA